MFRFSRTADTMRWTVMSGDKVATTMIAEFEPLTDGGTHVVAHVERGDAPDDFVAPAFRSTGVTLGLFSMALEGKLNALVQPTTTDQAACDRLENEFTDANLAAGAGKHAGGLRDAVGGTAATIVRLNGFAAERRRLGCHDDGNDGEFRPVSEKMGPGEEGTAEQPSHKPGEPMLDPTPADERKP